MQKNNSRDCGFYPGQSSDRLLRIPALQCFEIPKKHLLQGSGLCAIKQTAGVRRVWPESETGIGGFKEKVRSCQNMPHTQ